MGLRPLKSLGLQHWPGPAQGVSGCGLSSIVNFTFGGGFAEPGAFFSGSGKFGGNGILGQQCLESLRRRTNSGACAVPTKLKKVLEFDMKNSRQGKALGLWMNSVCVCVCVCVFRLVNGLMTLLDPPPRITRLTMTKEEALT